MPVPPDIIIAGLTLLGAAMALCVYHLFLFLQYKERVIIAYAIYLFSLAVYIAVYLVSINYFQQNQFAFIYFLKESASLMTVLGYTYFLFAVLEDWHETHPFFFRTLKIIMVVMTGYCVFAIAAGLLQMKWLFTIPVLPYASRLILLIMAIIAAFLFFPLMKNQFLKLIRLGSAIYLLIVALLVLTIVLGGSKFLWLDSIQLFFAGVLIDLVIFSIAMAYKVKSVFTRIMEVRQKISQDLHDDIGASLSSLQIYSVIAESTFKTNPEKAIEMMRKISSQSKTVMENMNDLVWSMKVNDSNTTSLETKIRNYSVELLGDRNIDFKFTITPLAETTLKNVTARKNILLIIKEALNNIAKYSKASQASLDITIIDKTLELNIADNGIGFELSQKTQSGNGLHNMKQRANELEGNLVIESAEGSGTRLMARFPLTSL